MQDDQEGRRRQGQQIIDQPVGEQRSEQRRPGHLWHCRQHHRLEQPDAARHMADQGDDDPQRVGKEEGREERDGGMRQQHKERPAR